MGQSLVRSDFADRMSTICDLLNIPAGHGRQTLLGKRFGVTAKAARKWLLGTSLPELETAIRIAEEARVSVIWLLQGAGPREVPPRPIGTAAIAEAIDDLPMEDRQGVLDFVRYKFERADGWFSGEKMARYMKLLDQLSKPPGTGP